jgi:hypothetical protein
MCRHNYAPLRYHSPAVPCPTSVQTDRTYSLHEMFPTQRRTLISRCPRSIPSPLHRQIRQSLSANSGPAWYESKLCVSDRRDCVKRHGAKTQAMFCVCTVGAAPLIRPIRVSVRERKDVRSLHRGNVGWCKNVDRFKKLSVRGRKQ